MYLKTDLEYLVIVDIFRWKDQFLIQCFLMAQLTKNKTKK